MAEWQLLVVLYDSLGSPCLAVLAVILFVGDSSVERPSERGMAREDGVPLAAATPTQDRAHPTQDIRRRPPRG
jgi:hypothetical protein